MCLCGSPPLCALRQQSLPLRQNGAFTTGHRGRVRKYWSFYWPLALTGVAMVLAVQFQNGALARYPNAVQEIAVFALAASTFGFFNAGMNFTAQLSNVFARSPGGRRASQGFVAAWSLMLTVPLAAVALTPPGALLVSTIYGIDEGLTDRVLRYLALMLPLLFVTGQRMFLVGMLVQAHLTGWVTALNVVFLVATIATLVAGFSAGLDAVYTLVGAQTAAALLHWGLVHIAVAKRYRNPERPEHEEVTWLELARFFLPVTATGFMFAISRPVLYAFVSRAPEGLASIAAMRIAFDLSSIFQQAANQFRHFFVTFGLSDLPAKRRFMALVSVGITGVMLLIALTPVSGWLFGTALGIDGITLERALDVLLVLCLMPTVIIVRNYFHGVLMVRRRTGGMALGGVLRVGAIVAAAQALFLLDMLDHIAATYVLLLGFVAETAVVASRARRLNGAE